jgi:hypothetical protein
MGECEQFRSERWKKIDGLGNFANLGGGRGVLYALNNYANEGFIAKWDEHTAAGLHGIAQRIGDRVGEGVAQRNGQRHVAEWKAHLDV